MGDSFSSHLSAPQQTLSHSSKPLHAPPDNSTPLQGRETSHPFLHLRFLTGKKEVMPYAHSCWKEPPIFFPVLLPCEELKCYLKQAVDRHVCRGMSRLGNWEVCPLMGRFFNCRREKGEKIQPKEEILHEREQMYSSLGSNEQTTASL